MAANGFDAGGGPAVDSAPGAAGSGWPAPHVLQGRANRLVAAFGGWTVLAWVTRIRNAAADSSLDAPAKAVAVGSAVGFTAMGAVALAYAWRARGGAVSVEADRFVRAFAGITTAWWAVRTVLVWMHEHDTPFRVVHTVLAVVSVVLGLMAWRAAAAAASATNH